MVEENKEAETELVFECTICKKLYKKPGMCSECQAVLKPRGG